MGVVPVLLSALAASQQAAKSAPAALRASSRARISSQSFASVDEDVSRRVGPIVALNAAVQKTTRPAARAPLFRTPHAWQEEWLVNAGAQAFVDALRVGVPALNDRPDSEDFVYEVDKASFSGAKGSVQVSVYTRLRWLDIVEMDVEEQGLGQCMVRVRVCSTGVVPLSVPGAAVLNLAAGLVPFSDVGLSERKTCPDLRTATGGMNITVRSKGRQL